jgi:hypothetical protein
LLSKAIGDIANVSFTREVATMSELTMSVQERRVQPRRQPKPTAHMICCSERFGGERNLAVAFLDISMGGAQLVVTEPLETCDEVAVGLEAEASQWVGGPKKAIWSIADAQVMRSVPLPDGSYCVGVHFDQTLSASFFLALTGEN